jgi:hypothetical protein
MNWRSRPHAASPERPVSGVQTDGLLTHLPLTPSRWGFWLRAMHFDHGWIVPLEP